MLLHQTFPLESSETATQKQEGTTSRVRDSWHNIFEQVDLIKSLDLSDSLLEQARHKFESKSEDFKERKDEATLELFHSKKNMPKAPNKRQQNRSVTHTAIALNQIEWSRLRMADHLDDLVKELLHRFPEKESEINQLLQKKAHWSKLKKMLQEHEGNDKVFKPRCPDPEGKMFRT